MDYGTDIAYGLCIERQRSAENAMIIAAYGDAHQLGLQTWFENSMAGRASDEVAKVWMEREANA